MPFRRITGFTLIELMIAIAVLAVLVAIGFPSFQNVMRSNRVATGTNELIAAVSLARTEAIRNNRGSSICGSQSGAACDGTWTQGWIVWADTDANGVVDAGETVLRYVSGNGGVEIAGPAGFLHFDARGRRTSTAADAGALIIQPARCDGKSYRRTLALSPTGQIRKAGDLAACQ